LGTAIVNGLPKAIGVKLFDDEHNDIYVEHLIAANTQLPHRAKTFEAATVFPNQPGVQIELYEQAGPEPDRAMSSNNPIQQGEGIISLEGYNLPAGSIIYIDIEADSEGTVMVTAREPTSGRDLTIKVQMALLSDSEVEQSKFTHLKRAITS